MSRAKPRSCALSVMRARVLVLMSLLLGCGGNAGGQSPARVFEAGPLAAAHGIERYDVHHAGPRTLDVSLLGPQPGRLRIEVINGVTTQRLERGGTFTLRTHATGISIHGAESAASVAKRQGATWVAGAQLDGADRTRLALLMAVDTDLAVQGASMVFDGALYAWCTKDCSEATRCLYAGTLAHCAPTITVCGACLEQEPLR